MPPFADAFGAADAALDVAPEAGTVDDCWIAPDTACSPLAGDGVAAVVAVAAEEAPAGDDAGAAAVAGALVATATPGAADDDAEAATVGATEVALAAGMADEAAAAEGAEAAADAPTDEAATEAEAPDATAAPDASSSGTVSVEPSRRRLGSCDMNAFGLASNNARVARTRVARSCEPVASIAISLSDWPGFTAICVPAATGPDAAVAAAALDASAAAGAAKADKTGAATAATLSSVRAAIWVNGTEMNRTVIGIPGAQSSPWLLRQRFQNERKRRIPDYSTKISEKSAKDQRTISKKPAKAQRKRIEECNEKSAAKRDAFQLFYASKNLRA